MADALPTKINLTVVTRERKIIDTEVDEVVLPASDGEPKCFCAAAANVWYVPCRIPCVPM